MFERLIRFAIEQRWLVIFVTLGVAAIGVYNYTRLAIDAVPDITNVQVQINVGAPGYSPLETEQRITYPVETQRLDLFTSFLDPAGVQPERVRHAELTTMIVQLVASGRGVACLPNWALYEYQAKDYLAVRSLGEEGVWPTLYAAVRDDQAQALFMTGFIDMAIETCFANLVGVVTAELG